MVLLILNEKAMFITERQQRIVLDVAKKYVPHGIYATEHYGFIELLNEVYDTEEELMESAKKYEENGIKVYYNK